MRLPEGTPLLARELHFPPKVFEAKALGTSTLCLPSLPWAFGEGGWGLHLLWCKGTWDGGHARICGECPALNTRGSFPRPGAPGGGVPAAEAAAPQILRPGLFATGRGSARGTYLAWGWTGPGVGGGDGVSTGLHCCGGGQWPVRSCREQMTPTGDPGAITGELPAGAAGPWGPCAGQGAARALGGGQQGASTALRSPQSGLRPSEERPLSITVLKIQARAIFCPWKSWERGGNRCLGRARPSPRA